MHQVTTPVVKAAEVVAVSALLGAANAWFFPANAGFLHGTFNPYAVISLFIAVYYGKYYGFLSLGASALAVLAGIAVGAFPASTGIPALSGPVIAVSVVEVYILGLMRDTLARRESRAAARLSSLARAMGLLKRQGRALEATNRELDERIARQRDSITSLYSQVQALGSLNLSKAFHAILEMVRRFVGAARCSVWEHRPEEKSLTLAASLGWQEGTDAPTILRDDASIEGWVVRNNHVFSVKMLSENEALVKLDTGRNIITLPLSAGRRIWGVLNIEEMPFEKYNLYTERLLLVIMALARPFIERGIEFESLVRQEDTNPATGLASFPQFYAMLQLEFARLAAEKGTLAIVIVELANFDEIAERHGKQRSFGLLRDLAAMARDLAGGPSWVFHYKAEPQLAMVCPNLDADGASLFALGLLGKLNETEWRVGDERVALDVVLGFAARSGGRSPDELLETAERLLEMQKV